GRRVVGGRVLKIRSREPGVASAYVFRIRNPAPYPETLPDPVPDADTDSVPESGSRQTSTEATPGSRVSPSIHFPIRQQPLRPAELRVARRLEVAAEGV